MAQQVSLTTMTDVITRALARWPEHALRIEKAATLLALGHVQPTEPGWYAVKSQTTPAALSYAVTVESCPCKDRERHPERACKHVMAVRLLEIAQERQRRLDERERTALTRRFAPLTGDELARLTAWKRRYTADSAALSQEHGQ